MNKYYCIESTLDFKLLGCQIRVWRNETEVKSQYYSRDIKDAVSTYIAQSGDVLSIADIAEYIASLDRVNAVQVKKIRNVSGGHEEGVMLYTVPF